MLRLRAYPKSLSTEMPIKMGAAVSGEIHWDGRGADKQSVACPGRTVVEDRVPSAQEEATVWSSTDPATEGLRRDLLRPEDWLPVEGCSAGVRVGERGSSLVS